MKHVRKRLTYANVMSSLAVFLILSGATAFAAGQLGKNTVGAKQLKKEAVTPSKISAAAKSELKGATGPQGPAGAKGDKGDRGEKGNTGEPGSALGFVEVNASGTILNGNAKNIVQSDITSGGGGVICFDNLPFAWKVVTATRSGEAGADGVAMYTRGAAGTCAVGTEVTISNRLFNTTSHDFEASGNPMTVVFN